ncbi:hypothetical protein [Actinomadura coerulea]|uniref:hypothetical protein n=1 Tax=Actinomadura coerulea TaxID=46159 RepID=UPI00343017AC
MNFSTRLKPAPSRKSMSTVATGFGPGDTATRTTRFTGSSSLSARLGVTPAGIFFRSPWSRPGSDDRQGPLVDLFLVVAASRQYPVVPFPGPRAVTTLGPGAGGRNAVPAGERRSQPFPRPSPSPK